MTLKEMGKTLGVSPSTISKVLNNSPNFSIPQEFPVRFVDGKGALGNRRPMILRRSDSPGESCTRCERHAEWLPSADAREERTGSPSV